MLFPLLLSCLLSASLSACSHVDGKQIVIALQPGGVAAIDVRLIISSVAVLRIFNKVKERRYPFYQFFNKVEIPTQWCPETPG